MGEVISLPRSRRGKPHIFKFNYVWIKLVFGRADGRATGAIFAAKHLAGPYESTNSVGSLMVADYLQERGFMFRMVSMIEERAL